MNAFSQDLRPPTPSNAVKAGETNNAAPAHEAAHEPVTGTAQETSQRTQGIVFKADPETLQDTLTRLNRILAKTLRTLGDQGAADEACELAAEAWSILRGINAKEAERMNGVLHQLTSTRCSSKNGTDSKNADEIEEVEEIEEIEEVQDFDLEVRHLPPAQRHELIFETYHKLQSGQGFILINDHDPKPLYYQFAFEYPDRFTWTEIEMGPDVWRVRIGKPSQSPKLP